MSFDIQRFLRVVAEHEVNDQIWWTEDLEFFVNCSDLFYWACSDVEPVETDSDIDLLIKACKDAGLDGPLLYCARKRGVRPQGAYYKHFSPEARPLFDQCGAYREANFGNPVASGEQITPSNGVESGQ